MLQYKDGKLILPEGRVELAPLPGALNNAPTSPASVGKSEEELSESGSEEEEQFSDIYSDGELTKGEPISFLQNDPLVAYMCYAEDGGSSEEDVSSVASSGSRTVSDLGVLIRKSFSSYFSLKFAGY